MYLDREFRIPEKQDSPICWPGEAAWMAVFSPYCCGWHVTGIGACYTDPMGLLVTYGNDWQWVDGDVIEHGHAYFSTPSGTLTATGTPGTAEDATFTL